MIRVLVKPAKRLFGRRRQWRFEIRGANGERIDPRDTYANHGDVVSIMELLFTGEAEAAGLREPFEPVELVLYDRHGNIEDRRQLR